MTDQHPFVTFREKYEISDDVFDTQLVPLLGYLGQRAADRNPVVPGEVEAALAAIFPKQRSNREFFEELLRSWESGQFDHLREHLRSHGWSC